MRVLGARFNRWWIAMWATNCAVLGASALVLKPGAWVAEFFVLFLLPELVGLRTRGDSLPPLTYVIRRYAPRWVPDALTFITGAWLAFLWIPSAEHPAVVGVMIAAFIGWLTNHWDVSYDGPGE